jgi:hypothetical protein
VERADHVIAARSGALPRLALDMPEEARSVAEIDVRTGLRYIALASERRSANSGPDGNRHCGALPAELRPNYRAAPTLRRTSMAAASPPAARHGRESVALDSVAFATWIAQRPGNGRGDAVGPAKAPLARSWAVRKAVSYSGISAHTGGHAAGDATLAPLSLARINHGNY